MKKVSFTRMADGTREDYELIEQADAELAARLPDRLLRELEALRDTMGCLQVTRLEHSLQSATRAHSDGRSEEYVVAALLHDIGDELAPFTHGEMVAAILKPYVSPDICWIVSHHGVFQEYYSAHLLGGDRHVRDRYRDHPCYQACVEFCELYDQNCFDPEYDALPLEFFEPLLRRVVAERRYLG